MVRTSLFPFSTTFNPAVMTDIRPPERGGYEYEGAELMAMRLAVHYTRHIRDLFRPMLRGAVMEVGAGVGTMSSRFLESPIEHLTLVEPDHSQASILEQLVVPAGKSVTVRAGFLEDLSVDRLQDGAIAINVLEHVEHHEEWLRALRSHVRPGGWLGLYVPAHQWLFGEMDARLGHHRRYSKALLQRIVATAGWRIHSTGWANLPNLVGWWWMAKVRGVHTLSASSVEWYDRWVGRYWLPLERRIPPPVGTNLWLLARSPEESGLGAATEP